MNINNRCVALVYRVCAFLLGMSTLVYDFGIFSGEFKGINLFYFTILSNLGCMCLFLALIIKTIFEIKSYGIYGSSSVSPHIKGGIMICILLTMTVYHFILIPYALKVNPYQSLGVTDVIFHYVIPFLTLFDWILFDEKKSFSWYDPILWTVLPYLYIIFVFIQSRFDIVDRISANMNRYIYAFLDIGLLGSVKVLFNIFLLTVAFVIVGYCLVILDCIKLNIGNDIKKI